MIYRGAAIYHNLSVSDPTRVSDVTRIPRINAISFPDVRSADSIWVPDPCQFRVLDCSTNVSGTQ
jgi:hypothetical protein